MYGFYHPVQPLNEQQEAHTGRRPLLSRCAIISGDRLEFELIISRFQLKTIIPLPLRRFQAARSRERTQQEKTEDRERKRETKDHRRSAEDFGE